MRLFHGIAFALIVPALIAHAGAPDKLTTQRTSAPRPTVKPVGDPLPRPVLFVQTSETGETFDEPSATSFYVYDPADPKAGLRKIFHGPSTNQYCRFITPLFNGCGIAVGQLDAQKEPDSPRTMFWFDLLSGRIGKTIARQTRNEEMIDTDVWFLSAGALTGSGDSLEHINRYDCQSDTLIHYEKGYTQFRPLGSASFLAVESPPAIVSPNSSGDTLSFSISESKEPQRITKVNLTNNTAESLGELPKGGLPSFSLDEATGVYPAGADCRDGIYCIRNFCLYFKPPKDDWHTVVENVKIVKTFGGRLPHLPVVYLGKGRFAVAKTTEDHVEVPEQKKKNFDGTPGLSVTMLIDGRTRKVLNETKPQLYDNNPSLNVPDDWWSPDAKPLTLKRQISKPSRFQMNDAGKTIRFAGNKQITLAENEEAVESGDGRYLAIAGASRGKKPPAKIILRIVDGKNGTVTECPITADTKNLSVTAAWQVLCSERPDKATLDAFRSSGVNYFQEPMANW